MDIADFLTSTSSFGMDHMYKWVPLIFSSQVQRAHILEVLLQILHVPICS